MKQNLPVTGLCMQIGSLRRLKFLLEKLLINDICSPRLGQDIRERNNPQCELLFVL